MKKTRFRHHTCPESPVR